MRPRVVVARPAVRVHRRCRHRRVFGPPVRPRRFPLLLQVLVQLLVERRLLQPLLQLRHAVRVAQRPVVLRRRVQQLRLLHQRLCKLAPVVKLLLLLLERQQELLALLPVQLPPRVRLCREELQFLLLLLQRTHLRHLLVGGQQLVVQVHHLLLEHHQAPVLRQARLALLLGAGPVCGEVLQLQVLRVGDLLVVGEREHREHHALSLTLVAVHRPRRTEGLQEVCVRVIALVLDHSKQNVVLRGHLDQHVRDAHTRLVRHNLRVHRRDQVQLDQPLHRTLLVAQEKRVWRHDSDTLGVARKQAVEHAHLGLLHHADAVDAVAVEVAEVLVHARHERHRLRRGRCVVFIVALERPMRRTVAARNRACRAAEGTGPRLAHHGSATPSPAEDPTLDARPYLDSRTLERTTTEAFSFPLT
eukprot:Rhum_TRINITY_DN20672_c0_g1::Rhum_TRINITY_DN20672_c0_g1_i1::g.171735::m.171735